MGSSGLLRRVLTAATAVFLLDGLYVVAVFAWVLHLTTAERIFRGIAVAVLGPSGRTADGAAALGVVLHFLVALGWSAVWGVAYQHSAWLRRRLTTTAVAAAAGAAYGAAVWLAMQLLVLPLTRAPGGVAFTRTGLLVLLAHVLVVGPPIVLLIRSAPDRNG